MKRVTINDIARQLNVSACTVSKILNGKGNFSEPMKKLVVETASEMGYTPNRLAEALVRRDLRMLVVTTNAWPEYIGLLEKGVSNEVKLLHDFHLYASHLKLDITQETNHLVDTMKHELSSQPDAIVLCGSGVFFSQPPMLNLLNDVKCPIVLIGLDAPLINSSALVLHDSVLSGMMAAELLSSMNVPGDFAVMICNRSVPDSLSKLQGFTNEAERRGYRLAHVMEADDSPETAKKMMKDCLDRYPNVRGLYIATDNSTSACQVIASQGHTRRMSVVATGAFSELITYMERGVINASLYQNMHQQGQLGVRLVYRLLTDRVAPDRQVLIPPSIVLNANWRSVCLQDEFGPLMDAQGLTP
ncbi:MAG: LacI family DNA-binding transcriptional regulator [Armatimonadota bacterium]